MRKLKLESLQVESFDTTPAAPSRRGTVIAHGVPTNTPVGCGPTNDQVCTFTCSWDTNCPTACFGETEGSCPSALDDC
jgi:hypothetical protein